MDVGLAEPQVDGLAEPQGNGFTGDGHENGFRGRCRSQRGRCSERRYYQLAPTPPSQKKRSHSKKKTSKPAPSNGSTPLHNGIRQLLQAEHRGVPPEVVQASEERQRLKLRLKKVGDGTFLWSGGTGVRK